MSDWEIRLLAFCGFGAFVMLAVIAITLEKIEKHLRRIANRD